jgi:hypothetical protein
VLLGAWRGRESGAWEVWLVSMLEERLVQAVEVAVAVAVWASLLECEVL